MSDLLEFLLTFALAVGLPFVVGGVLAYFGYTQNPRNGGLLRAGAGFIVLAFLAGIGTILFFVLVPQQAGDPVAEYQREVADRMDRIELALDRMTLLLLRPRLAHSSWHEDLTTQAAVIQLEYEGIGRMNPPPEMIQAHRSLLDALGDCDRAMANLTTDVERLDLLALGKANKLMTSCGNKITALN